MSVATKCSHFGMTECSRGRRRRQNLATIKDYTRKIAEALHVCGLMNMQYAIEDGKVFVLEANPRASRTVPLVSKVCNTQMARLATRLMLGEKLEDLKLKDKKLQKPTCLGHVQASLPATLGFMVFNHHGAKEAVFPFDKLQKLPRLGNARASTVTALGLRCFLETRCNQGRQMLRASEAGLLAGLFPSPAFGTRRVQSAIRKAAIKSVQGKCRTKMLAFLYDRTEATDAKRQLQGSLHHDPRRCLQHREGNCGSS